SSRVSNYHREVANAANAYAYNPCKFAANPLRACQRCQTSPTLLVIGNSHLYDLVHSGRGARLHNVCTGRSKEIQDARPERRSFPFRHSEVRVLPPQPASPREEEARIASPS